MRLKFIQYLALLCLLFSSNVTKAQDISYVLGQLNLDASIQNDLNLGLIDIAKPQSWNKDALMDLFERMNATLSSEFQVNTESPEALSAFMDDLDKKISPTSSMGKINSDKYSKNKEIYMKNALYLALMGKALNHYLKSKYDIILADHATIAGALDALVKVRDGKITTRFMTLKTLLNQYHIQLAWLPEMLERF